MDPVSLAQNLATLVGLLCNFRQERGATEQLNHQQFIEWLEYHRHEELKKLISTTHHLTREIDEILRNDQQAILRRLSALDEVFATVLSKLDGFSGLVSALAPEVGISTQAGEVLVHLADSNAELMFLLPNTGMGPVLCLSPGQGFRVGEPRFLHDDLSVLVQYGFLVQGYTSSGNPDFKLTRSGAKYAALLKERGVCAIAEEAH